MTLKIMIVETSYCHIPVLREKVVQYLITDQGGIYVDATVGEGGHAEAILERLNCRGRLIGIDRDEEILMIAHNRLARFHSQLKLFYGNFKKLKEILKNEGVPCIQGILFDLGVSSRQLDTPERGFSFRFDANLDMRMDRRQSLTAAEIVNRYSREKLTEIFRDYGEEPRARQIASAIVKTREKQLVKTTSQLLKIIEEVVKFPRLKIHPATRCFQALRIVVNQELEGLEDSLRVAVDLLVEGGRIGVISFHSLEDRIVKQTFRLLEGKCICPPDFPVCRCGKIKKVRVLTPKPLTPSPLEKQTNPRSRSARFRVAEKI